jgi:hypothetical protein
VLITDLCDHPHRPLTQLRRIPPTCHDPIFPNQMESPDTPGRFKCHSVRAAATYPMRSGLTEFSIPIRRLVADAHRKPSCRSEPTNLVTDVRDRRS